MGTTRSFAKNTFWYSASTMIVILVGAVYRPIIGRLLGAAEFGRYSFIFTFIGYFTILALFGGRQVIMREIGRDRRNTRHYLRSALRVRALTTLAAMLLCAGIGVALQRNYEVTFGILIMTLSLVIAGAIDLFESVLVAFERSAVTAVANLTGSLLRLSVGVWALKAGFGLLGVIWVYLITSCVTMIIQWLAVRSAVRGEEADDTSTATDAWMFRSAVPFVVLSVATRFYAKNDILFLTMMRGDTATGFYSAAYIFVDLLMAVSSSVAVTSYPVIARVYGASLDSGDENKLGAAYERLHKYMLLALLPISVLLMSVGSSVLVIVFGRDFFGSHYAAGTQALQILGWTPPIETSCMLSGTFLCATYHQKLDAKIATAMTILNVMWTVSFIYFFGATGAAIATVGASAVNAAVHYFYVRKVIGASGIVKTGMRAAVCTAVMLGAVSVVPQTMWMLRVPAGLAVFGMMLPMLGLIDPEDRRLFSSLRKRGR